MQRNISFRVGKNLVHHDNHLPRWMHIFRVGVLFNEVSKQCYKRYIQHKYRIYVSIVEKNMDNYELRKTEQ